MELEPKPKFAIIHMMKHKRHAVTGMQIHNRREKESHTNKDIEQEKTALNYHLKGGEGRYIDLIDARLDELPKRDSKLKSNAVYASEFIITASPEYMNELSDKEQKRYFETALKYVEERYNAKNVVWATVHMDEKNPHMHCGVVPIKDDRLNARAIFTRSELRQLHDTFHQHMRGAGFDVERGKFDSKQKHLSKVELRIEEKKQVLEQEVEYVAKKKAKIAQERTILEKAEKDSEETLKRLGIADIDQIKQRGELIETIENSKQTLLGFMPQWILKEQTKKAVVDVLNDSVYLMRKLKQEQDEHRSKEYSSKNEISGLKDKVLNLEMIRQNHLKGINKLTEENKKLKEENRLVSALKVFARKVHELSPVKSDKLFMEAQMEVEAKDNELKKKALERKKQNELER